MSIYIEILIRGTLDELWARTQDPAMHQQWDLRFTSIDYLPQSNPAQPQRFLYATRIGFGLCIRGAGETVGSNIGPGGARTSALKFWSDDRKSLIQAGSGYWKYIPGAGGVRFLTRYDYRTRFGIAGYLFDRAIFRPLIGWATAWSFDRLRIWIEHGISPAASLRRSLAHGLVRLTLAGFWLAAGGMAGRPVFGWAAAFALGLLLSWRVRLVLPLNAGLVGLAMLQLARGPAVPSVVLLLAHILAIVLSLLGYIVGADLPSARRCLRKPQEQA
jgi:hypothetical protein